MNTTPNYELFKEAYSIIDGIPEEYLNLDTIVSNDIDHVGCGTIACAAGWLGLHPTFQKLGLSSHVYTEKHCSGWLSMQGTETYYAEVMADIFGTSIQIARNIFSSAGNSIYDNSFIGGTQYRNHKALWKHRVVRYLKEKGQL